MQKERDIIMQSLSEFEHLSPANRHKVLQEVKKASQEKARELGVGKLGDWTYGYFEFNPEFDRRNPNSSYLHCATCGRGVKYLYVCYDSNGNKRGFGESHVKDALGLSKATMRDFHVLRNYAYQKSEEYTQELLKKLKRQKGELIFLLNHPGYYIGNLDKLLQENQAQKLLDDATAIQVAKALKKYQKRQAEKRHQQELIRKQEEKRRRKQQQERERQELEDARKEWKAKARARQLQQKRQREQKELEQQRELEKARLAKEKAISQAKEAIRNHRFFLNGDSNYPEVREFLAAKYNLDLQDSFNDHRALDGLKTYFTGDDFVWHDDEQNKPDYYYQDPKLLKLYDKCQSDVEILDTCYLRVLSYAKNILEVHPKWLDFPESKIVIFQMFNYGRGLDYMTYLKPPHYAAIKSEKLAVNYFGDQIRERYKCSSYHFFQMLTEAIYQSFLKRNLIFQDNDIQYKSLINQDGDPIS